MLHAMYRVRWWIGGLLARLVTLILFKGVEVTGSVHHDGPRLVVANHFGGLVDAIVAIRALGGLPHIVAKSTLFRTIPLRLALRALGVVPVYRRSDHSDMSKNVSSFDEVAKALRKGRTVLIFPEGTVTDSQELQRVRTGAARMTLRSIEVGVEGLGILPMGITYEDKVSTRSRVLVESGELITEAEVRRLGAGELAESNRALVTDLTEMIRRRLAAVAPDYGSLIRERTMMLAASIRIRSDMSTAFDEPSMSDLRSVAQRVARATDGGGDDQLAETGGYQLALSGSGLEDHQIQPTPRSSDLAKVALRKGVIVLLISPLALIGLAINLIAIILVVLVGVFVKEPVSKGTARVITGMVVFPLLWLVVAVVNDRFWWLALTLELVGLVFLVILVTQVVDLFEAVTGWWAVRNHVALIPELRAIRAEADEELRGLLAEGEHGRIVVDDSPSDGPIPGIGRYLERARRSLDRVRPEDFAAEVEAGAVVVDVRPQEQRDRDGVLPGAHVIGLDVLEWRLAPSSDHRIVDVNTDQRVILVCNEGYSSSLAAVRLRELGLRRATDVIDGYTGLASFIDRT